MRFVEQPIERSPNMIEAEQKEWALACKKRPGVWAIVREWPNGAGGGAKNWCRRLRQRVSPLAGDGRFETWLHKTPDGLVGHLRWLDAKTNSGEGSSGA